MSRDARGRRAEWFAAGWLQLKGYRILARRFATPVGEIDLIARRGGLLVFVEVKQRETLANALAAVRPAQQRRIERAASYFLAGRADLATLDMRFDVVAFGDGLLPRHVTGAWQAPRA